MTDSAHFSFTGLILIALTALALGIVARIFRQPPVIGYILAGAILGPQAFGIMQNRESIEVLAELGVLSLLFLIGLELPLPLLKKTWRRAFLVCSVQIFSSVAVAWILGFLLGWSNALALTIAFAVALSSTAVAMAILDDIGERDTRVGHYTIPVLIAQDLAVVPMMLVISSLQDADRILWFNIMGRIAAGAVILGGLLWFLGRREVLHLPMLQKILRRRELGTLVGVTFCLCCAWLFGKLGLSSAYGAFIAGLILGHSTAGQLVTRRIDAVQSILMMVFFLSIGLLLDFTYLLENWRSVLFLVFVLAGLKTVLNMALAKMAGETWPQAVLAAAALSQMGEFSFIIATLGVSNNVISDQEHQMLITLTAISLIMAPLWLYSARRAHQLVLLGVISWSETWRLSIIPEPMKRIFQKAFWRRRKQSRRNSPRG